jgi:hypothetical protein
VLACVCRRLPGHLIGSQHRLQLGLQLIHRRGLLLGHRIAALISCSSRGSCSGSRLWQRHLDDLPGDSNRRSGFSCWGLIWLLRLALVSWLGVSRRICTTS